MGLVTEAKLLGWTCEFSGGLVDQVSFSNQTTSYLSSTKRSLATKTKCFGWNASNHRNKRLLGPTSFYPHHLVHHLASPSESKAQLQSTCLYNSVCHYCLWQMVCPTLGFTLLTKRWRMYVMQWLRTRPSGFMRMFWSIYSHWPMGILV